MTDDQKRLSDEELERLARHAGMHDEDYLPHPPTGVHPLCDWCQYPHIRGDRLITEVRSLRAEVERLRAVDLQQVAAGVLSEYSLCHEDVFHIATRIAEQAEAVAAA